MARGAVNSATVVVDFDGEDPLAEQNIRAMYNWMAGQLEDDRVLETFGYAMRTLA